MEKSPPQKKNLLEFELKAHKEGYQNIAGVDEVGRGCLAGPVVAACVILPFDSLSLAQGRPWHKGINDSKQLKAEQRESLYPLILERAIAFGIGIVDSKDIDRMNILRASLKAMRLAVENLKKKPDCLLVDGNQSIDLLTIPQYPIPKGDCLSLSIAAASIIAKVTRDRLMQQMDQEFPGFSFGQHKGYGTKKHYEELRTLGPTPIHRLSFLK